MSNHLLDGVQLCYEPSELQRLTIKERFRLIFIKK